MQLTALALCSLAAVLTVWASPTSTVVARDAPTDVFPTIPSMTPEQQASFQVALINAAADPSVQDKLTEDVNAATAAAVAVAQNFTLIGKQLQQIDALGFGSNFAGPWSDFRTRYIKLLQMSRDQASSVSQYAADYNDLLNDIFDPTFSLSPQDKINAMEFFANESTRFQQASDDISGQFEKLSGDLVDFTGNFASFAKDKLDQDNKDILALQEQIATLQTEMARLFASMIGVAAAAGGVGIGTAVAVSCFPLAAPAILVGALIIEGLLLGTQIGLAVTYAVDKAKVDDLNRQIGVIQAEIGVINAANATLNDLSLNGIPTLAQHIQLFTQVWVDVSHNAGDVAQWVRDGESRVFIPPKLAAYFNTTNTEYTALVTALKLYATTIDIPPA